MENIDWSKAPDWAGAVIKSDGGSMFWVSQFGGLSVRQKIESEEPQDDAIVDMNDPHTWKLVELRPAAWNGDDLPPVGLPCEWHSDSQTGWQEVVVLGYHGTDAWVQPKGKNSIIVGNPANFRPLRTPELMALDERKAGILEMIDVFGKDTAIWGLDSVREICCFLYDAGYRKTGDKS